MKREEYEDVLCYFDEVAGIVSKRISVVVMKAPGLSKYYLLGRLIIERRRGLGCLSCSLFEKG
jgi:hypothetical protein